MAGKSFRIAAWTVAALVTVILAASIGAGAYMVSYALNPDIERDMDVEKALACTKYPGLVEWVDSLESAGILRDTSVTDADGHEIHAYYARACKNSRKSAIVVHGYKSSPMSMMMIARMYRDSLGYNIVVPHLNYHGASEGSHVQMGWYDRLDIANSWIPLAHDAFSDTLEVVHGISMGAATTMMASGEELPDYVRGFVEDCGYSSVWNEYVGELKKQFGLPPFPVLHAANLVCRIKYGWSFKEASSVRQLAKCALPMLFIHGDSDDYVPTSHVYVNYDAKTTGYRELWLVPDTDHANSYRNYPAEYTSRVRTFLREHVEQ